MEEVNNWLFFFFFLLLLFTLYILLINNFVDKNFYGIRIHIYLLLRLSVKQRMSIDFKKYIFNLITSFRFRSNLSSANGTKILLSCFIINVIDQPLNERVETRGMLRARPAQRDKYK